MTDVFPIERLSDIERNPSEFRLLSKVPLCRADILESLPYSFKNVDCAPGNALNVVFVSIHSTGNNPERDRMISLSMVRCSCIRDKDEEGGERLLLKSVDAVFDGVENPFDPEDNESRLPDKVTAVSGIKTEDLKGKKFDESAVRRILLNDPLVIAFSGRLVRPIFESRFSSLPRLAWTCALTDPDWKSICGAGTFDFLLLNEGYFYDRFKPLEFTLSVCFMMYLYPTALTKIFSKALDCTYILEARNFPYDSKDLLKELGFRWQKSKSKVRGGKNSFWTYTAYGREAFEELMRKLDELDTDYDFHDRKKAVVRTESAYERFNPLPD